MSMNEDYLLIWWPLLDHLRDYASAQTELTGVAVRAGSKTPKDPYPCVEFTWDDESGKNLLRTDKGTLIIWADCWLKNAGKEPDSGYPALHTIMKSVCLIVARWSDAVLSDLNLYTDITLKSAISDADSNRPLCGARMVFEIEWRRSS